MKEEKNIFFTLPNILSLLRILLIPIFLTMIIQQKHTAAFIVFLLAGSTDFLDGLTARLWNLKTRIGALIDPTADKLLMTSSIIVLSLFSLNPNNTIPLWLTAAVIGRDVLIVLGAFVLFRLKDQKVFYPSILGKAHTVCVMGVILLVLYSNAIGVASPYLVWLFRLALAITLLSTIQYVIIGIRMLSPPKKS